MRIQKAVKKAKDDWIGAQCEEFETSPNKNKSKRACQLVKDLMRETGYVLNYPGQVWERLTEQEILSK